MSEPHLILGIGELLWDVLPDGMRLGGAPANFAVMAGHLGDRAAILSRIGRDELGRQAVDCLDPMPVETSFIEVDAVHETGRVTVGFVDDEPQYTIHLPAAWDFLELSDEWVQLAARADVLCFGSLAQRSLRSRQTMQALIAQSSASCIRIFDVNLRAPFYSAEVLEESLELATVVKMNEAEMPVVLDLLDIAMLDLERMDPAPLELAIRKPARDGPHLGSEQLRQAAEDLLQMYPTLELVAITRGSSGSLLVDRDAWDDHPGFPVKLADGIGAGDAFTAAIAHYLLRGANLATLNEAGNRWGSWMASQTGAMPALPDAVRDAIAAAIEKTD